MTTRHDPLATSVCDCQPAETASRTYFVWSSGEEKVKIEGVTEIHLTRDTVVLERIASRPLVIPRGEVLMVTCEVCSPPPFN